MTRPVLVRFDHFHSLASLGTAREDPGKLPHIATMEDEADTPTEQRPLATQGTRYSAVTDEADTPTEHRPLVSRGTRCGRAVVAGAALLSSGVMLSSRTRTNLAVESGAQPTGDPCYVDGTEDFPQGLQNLAGYETLGLPYGGILLADRGQFPELHGGRAYAVPIDRITRGYDALLESCMSGSDCAGPLKKSCSLVVTDEADAQLSCVESCVESRFRDFLEVDHASQDVLDTLETHASCYFPVLSAFTSTPSLVKSCVDPSFESPVPSDCYDCISGCLGDTTRGVLRLDCDAAYVSGTPLDGGGEVVDYKTLVAQEDAAR